MFSAHLGEKWQGKIILKEATASNIPEVFWLKLMALDADDDGLMSVDGFPVNLEKKTTKLIFLLKNGNSCTLTS